MIGLNAFPCWWDRIGILLAHGLLCCPLLPLGLAWSQRWPWNALCCWSVGQLQCPWWGLWDRSDSGFQGHHVNHELISVPTYVAGATLNHLWLTSRQVGIDQEMEEMKVPTLSWTDHFLVGFRLSTDPYLSRGKGSNDAVCPWRLIHPDTLLSTPVNRTADWLDLAMVVHGDSHLDDNAIRLLQCTLHGATLEGCLESAVGAECGCCG